MVPSGPSPQASGISAYLTYIDLQQGDYATVMCAMDALTHPFENPTWTLSNDCQAAELAKESALKIESAAGMSGNTDPQWQAFFNGVAQAGFDCVGGASTMLPNAVSQAATAWRPIRQSLSDLGYTNLPDLPPPVVQGP